MKSKSTIRYILLSILIGGLLFPAPSLAAISNPGLGDAIQGLQALSGVTGALDAPIDVDQNKKYDLAEVVAILQYAAGLRDSIPTHVLGIGVSGRITSTADGADITGVSIKVYADLNDNGAYESEEIFTELTDTNGFFGVTVPGAMTVNHMKVHAKVSGYSEYLQSFENVQDSLNLIIEMNPGSFLEVDLSGIPAARTRDGSLRFSTDEELTISVLRSQSKDRIIGRSVVGQSPDVLPEEEELVRMSLPLSSLKGVRSSGRVYANVAYIDSVNRPDTMPGSFKSEGEGETPVDMLTTYAAASFEVMDENGNPLMTDPHDYTSEIQIKISVPWEAYDTLNDEIAETLDKVETPLYYLDETTGIWKLHRNQDGSTNYGWLEDNFGNILTAENLAQLKDIETDSEGKLVKTGYAPAGADTASVTIYTAGRVHHFSIYNSDVAGRTISINGEIRDRNGNPVNAPIRYRGTHGQKNGDWDYPRGDKRRNLHGFTPGEIDSIVKHILSEDKSEREQWLPWVLNKNDPQLIQAIANGVRNFALEKRGEWADEKDDLARGIRAIFSNQWISDAVTDSTDLDTGMLDCSKAPDVCKGILAQAHEQMSKSSDAKKAVAFLMEIAVDAYNPNNLNIDYAMDKGLGMIELAMNTGNASSKLRKIPELLNTAKQIRDDIKNLYENGKPPIYSSPNWSNYCDKVHQLNDTMSDMKYWAKVAGEKLSRSARSGRAPVPQTQEEVDQMNQYTLYDYEDLGGVLYGAHKFRNYQWGYYEWSQAGGTVMKDVDRPTGLAGGYGIGVLEYFNGTGWVPLPGRSSLGVDAGHIVIPNRTSFGNGSPSSPVIYLGEWVIDTQPNVAVTGRLVDQNGDPHVNAGSIPVYVANEAFYPDGGGNITGTITLFNDSAYVSVQGYLYRQYPVSNGVLALDNIVIPDKVMFVNPYNKGIQTYRYQNFEVDASAYALSGKPISYKYELYSGFYSWWGEKVEPLLKGTSTQGQFTIPGVDQLGSYMLIVTATADNPLNDGSKPSQPTYFYIWVKNSPPVINAINTSSSTITVGDSFNVTLNVTDVDSDLGSDYNDIRYQQVYAACVNADGNPMSLAVQTGDDGKGNPMWTVRTDYSSLYVIPQEQISCTLSAYVTDKGWNNAKFERTISLAQNHMAPEIYYNSIRDQYTVSYPQWIAPNQVYFVDPNNDIVSYECDCGKGDGPVTGISPLDNTDLDPTADGIQNYCEYKEAKMDGGQVVPYTFTYKAVDSTGKQAVVTAQITFWGPLNMGVSFPAGLTVTPPGGQRPDETTNGTDYDIVELPSGENRSFQLSLTAASPNGDHSLKSFYYNVNYQPTYYSWWNHLTSGNADPLTGSGTAEVTIDRPGIYYVFSSAADTAGMWANYNKTFIVAAAFDHKLKLNNFYEDQLNPWYLSSDTLTFTTEPVDTPPGFTPAYAWQIKYDGSADFTDAGTSSQLSQTFPEGTHMIRLTLSNAADPTHSSVVKEVILKVYQALNPILTTTYTYPKHPLEVALGDDYPLTIGGLTRSVTIETASWRVSQSNGSPATGLFSIVSSTGLLQRTFKFLQEGSFTVQADVTDSQGLSATASHAFTVKAYPPVINYLYANDGWGAPPLTPTFISSASDPDGQVENYIWRITGSYVNGMGQTVTVDQTTIQNSGNAAKPNEFNSYTFNHEGTFKMTLIVEDNSGRKSAPSETVVTPAYNPPTISSLTANPPMGPIPLSVIFEATAAKGSGDIVRYDWDLGADGSIEQSGMQTTFTHTFNTTGTYTVELTVRDSYKKTAVKSVNVKALDPSAQTIPFHFRDLWADGLGGDSNFSRNDPHHEGGAKFTAIGSPPIIQVTPADTMDMSANLVGLPGYNGFWINKYGNDLLQNYFKTTQTTEQEAGLYSPQLNHAQVKVTYDPSVTCGKVITHYSPYDVYSGGERVLYFSETLGQSLSSQGKMHMVALLGSGGTYFNECTVNYYGYQNPTVWPIADPLNPPVVNFDPASPVTPRTVITPPGFAFRHARFTRNGSPLTLRYYDLKSDGSGNYPIPILSDTDYWFDFQYQSGLYSKYSVLRSSAELVKRSGDLTFDLTTGYSSFDLSLQNIPTGAGYVQVTFKGITRQVMNMAGVLAGNTNLSDVRRPDDAQTVEIAILDSDQEKILIYRKLTAAQFDALGNTVDFSTLLQTLTLGPPVLTTNTTDQSLDLFAASTGATLMVGHVSAVFSVNNGGTRTNTYRIMTDSLGMPIRLSYPIPELTEFFGTIPGTTTPPASTSGTVIAFALNIGYDQAMQTYFRGLGFAGGDPYNYLENFKKLADRFIEAGVVNEIITVPVP